MPMRVALAAVCTLHLGLVVHFDEGVEAEVRASGGGLGAAAGIATMRGRARRTRRTGRAGRGEEKSLRRRGGRPSRPDGEVVELALEVRLSVRTEMAAPLP
jgi:hypothetical protein